ncbi:hypothetical protein LINGRAHAP2_LOCUS10837 [Linum grandiflorum]
MVADFVSLSSQASKDLTFAQSTGTICFAFSFDPTGETSFQVSEIILVASELFSQRWTKVKYLLGSACRG